MLLEKLEHASILLRKNQKGLIIDPGKYTLLPAQIKDITTIIVSDEHYDHFHPANLKRLLQENAAAQIFATENVAQSLRDEGLPAQAIRGVQEFEHGGFRLRLAEGDHAVVYGPSPCKIITVSVDDFLYYPSDSFLATEKAPQVLALPIGGPWFNMTEAIDLAKKIDSAYVLPTHDFHLSEEGRQTHNRFVAGNISSDRQFLYLKSGQTKEFS